MSKRLPCDYCGYAECECGESVSPDLTDAERQAIARAVDIFAIHPRLADEGKAAALRSLLERTA